MAEPLNFFVVTKKKMGSFIIHHLELLGDVQEQLTNHFISMYEQEWTHDEVTIKNYAITLALRPHTILTIPDFALPDDVKRTASNVQHFPPFKLPLPYDEHLKGIIGCRAGLFLFQVCDARNLLTNKMALFSFQSSTAFRRLDNDALSIGDTLAGYHDGKSLYFRSLAWIGHMLDVGQYYEEATRDQARSLFGHSKFILPGSHSLDTYIDLLTTPMKRQIKIVLMAKTMDHDNVTPDKINEYSHQYTDTKFTIRGKFGDRKLELPTDTKQLKALLDSLEEPYFTSGMTQQAREASGYGPITKR